MSTITFTIYLIALLPSQLSEHRAIRAIDLFGFDTMKISDDARASICGGNIDYCLRSLQGRATIAGIVPA